MASVASVASALFAPEKYDLSVVLLFLDLQTSREETRGSN